MNSATPGRAGRSDDRRGHRAATGQGGGGAPRGARAEGTARRWQPRDAERGRAGDWRTGSGATGGADPAGDRRGRSSGGRADPTGRERDERSRYGGRDRDDRTGRDRADRTGRDRTGRDGEERSRYGGRDSQRRARTPQSGPEQRERGYRTTTPGRVTTGERQPDRGRERWGEQARRPRPSYDDRDRGRETRGHDTRGRETASRDNRGRDTRGRETAGRDNRGRDTRGRETAGRDTGERDRAYRDRDRGAYPARGRAERGTRERVPTGGRERRQERGPARPPRREEPARVADQNVELAPELADDIDPRELDRAVRAELRSLHRPIAERVARHLVATGRLLDEEPEQALAHALAARRLAARVAAVREAAGLAAYRAGQWSTAIAELRAYHRISGSMTHLALLADAERALGRPERAIDLFRTADRTRLDRSAAVELLIVAAGARRDLGHDAAAAAMLQVRELNEETEEPWLPRLRYAYADTLLDLDRREEAREWFARAAEVDSDALTDAAERLLELDGVVLSEFDDVDQTEDGESTPT